MKELSDCRVLIVDDVKANADVLVEALRADHKLGVALDGEAALRSIEKNPPDLVLLDIMMPGIDGYEVCRRLRAAPATREIPVMFLSSLEEVGSKALGFEVGGNDYLTKPFEVLEVKARVRSLLKAKAYSDSIKERIAATLAVAREIQLGILCPDVAARVAGTGLEVSARLESAMAVGGDFYEVLRLDDGRVLLAVGDVSGKGVPGALFMAVAATLLRTIVREHRDPAEILMRLNDALVVQNPRMMFVTLLCVVLDPSTGIATCANAGHLPPVLVRPGADPRLTVPSTGMMVGIIPGAEIGRATLELAPGDALVLYSDGVTEAHDTAERMFEEEGLLASLAQAAGRSADAIASTVLEAVHRHAGEAPQYDDITVLAVRRIP
jgi:sigma-B regulation protein RsbU (phosphoserine phosphatase)